MQNKTKDSIYYFTKKERTKILQKSKHKKCYPFSLAIGRFELCGDAISLST